MAKFTKNSTISATILLAAALFLVAVPVGTNGHSPVAAPGATPEPFAPAPGPSGLDCFPYLLNLSDCLTYVETGSNLTKPDKGCCPELANLVEVQPICLCELLGHPDQAPVAIDVNKALRLPSVCKVDAPPASTCAVLGIPIAAPVGAPTAGGPASGALSPKGLASSPLSTDNGNGSGQSIAASQRHFVVGLAIVLFISFF